MTSFAPHSATHTAADYGVLSSEPQARSRRSRSSVVRLGSLPSDTEQDLRFVQDRLALFGKTVFFISGAFLLGNIAAELLCENAMTNVLAQVSHLSGTLFAFGAWRLAKSRLELTPTALQALDIGATWAICAFFALMGHQYQAPGGYVGLLAIVYATNTRAVIVPSTPLRTLSITAVGFLGFVVSRAFVEAPGTGLESEVNRVRGLLDAVFWAVAGTALSTVASKVVYGLQEKAFEARQLGQYTLEHKIGQGGMGEIYRARHAMLRRPTAVKLLAGDGSEEQLRRFEKEVQLTARLTHPNTISIYDYGRTPEGTFYYAMELLDGLTLDELVDRYGPQPPGRVIHLLQQVCGALSEAHGIGLIHRDIKPANIHLSVRGGMSDVVKVLDFGLVREVKKDGNMTQSNVNSIVGTPLYLSPEAILSPEQIDARADIYGLGAVAYVLLTGSPPFSGRSVVEICGHHLHTTPEPPSVRAPHGLREDLEKVVLSCLSKDPADRPQSARALARALSACAEASCWSEVDADVWWGRLHKSAPEAAAPPAPPVSGDVRRRTICCGDLGRRLRTRQVEEVT